MLASEIPVVEFSKLEDNAEQQQLAKNAYKVLGYTRLLEAVLPTGSLLTALKRLDIHPLSREAVNEYKASKTKLFMRKSQIVLPLWWIGVMTPLVSLCWALIRHDFQHPSDLLDIFIALCVLTVLGAFATLCSATWGDDAYITPRMSNHWKLLTLRTYSGAVPEFALRKALQIADACPNVIFYVDQLVHAPDPNDQEYLRRQREAVRLRDPFLVAVLGSETYYIEVWDEQEYEKTL